MALVVPHQQVLHRAAAEGGGVCEGQCRERHEHNGAMPLRWRGLAAGSARIPTTGVPPLAVAAAAAAAAAAAVGATA